jgi:lipopolysaccharide export LptBFGC system permease protein LptF
MKEKFLMFDKGDLLVMLAAFLSFLFSVALWFGIGMSANKDAGIFVGIWVPSIISAGIYIRVARRGSK